MKSLKNEMNSASSKTRSGNRFSKATMAGLLALGLGISSVSAAILSGEGAFVETIKSAFSEAFTSAPAPNVPAVTRNVCGSGCEYSDLGSAIAESNPGDTIQLAPGDYSLSSKVSIRHGLTIMGPNANVGARGAEAVVNVVGRSFIGIAASDVTISGLKFVGGAGSRGIINGGSKYGGSASSVRILNNVFEGISLTNGAVINVAGGSRGARSSEWLIKDNTFNGTIGADASAVSFSDGGYSSSVVGNIFNDISGSAITLTSVKGVGIDSNRFSGVLADGVAFLAGAEGIRVRGNSFDRVNTAGAPGKGAVTVSASAGKGSVAENNFFANSPVGVNVGGAGDSLAIRLNHFDATIGTGISATNVAGGTVDAAQNFWGLATGPVARIDDGAGRVMTEPYISSFELRMAKAGRPGFWPRMSSMALAKQGSENLVPSSTCTGTITIGTTTYNSIQDAVDAASTASIDTIDVAAGTCIENVDIDRAVKILGANATVAASGTRATETIIKPASAGPATPSIATVSAIFSVDNALTDEIDGLEIAGFTFDGSNSAPGVSRGATRNGVEIDGDAVLASSSVGGTIFQNTKFKNNIVSNFGLEPESGASVQLTYTVNNLVHGDTNLVEDSDFSNSGAGVRIIRNYSSVESNTMSNVGIGIFVGAHQIADPTFSPTPTPTPGGGGGGGAPSPTPSPTAEPLPSPTTIPSPIPSYSPGSPRIIADNAISQSSTAFTAAPIGVSFSDHYSASSSDVSPYLVSGNSVTFAGDADATGIGIRVNRVFLSYSGSYDYIFEIDANNVSGGSIGLQIVGNFPPILLSEGLSAEALRNIPAPVAEGEGPGKLAPSGFPPTVFVYGFQADGSDTGIQIAADDVGIGFAYIFGSFVSGADVGIELKGAAAPSGLAVGEPGGLPAYAYLAYNRISSTTTGVKTTNFADFYGFNNGFYGHTTALQNDSPEDVEMGCSWWGQATGPDPSDIVEGAGAGEVLVPDYLKVDEIYIGECGKPTVTGVSIFLNATSTPGPFTYGDDVDIRVTASDSSFIKNVQYSFDGTNFTDLSYNASNGEWYVTLTNPDADDYDVYIKAFDRFDNENCAATDPMGECDSAHSFTVNKEELTVTPDDKTVTYGDAPPTYTKTVTGFISGESASNADGYVAPTCTSVYSATTSVADSTVDITCSGGSADNYTFDTTDVADLTINKATLTVTPDAKSRTYGDPVPTYTYVITGFKNSETETGATAARGYTAPTCTSSYAATTDVSASPLTISCSGGAATDYNFTLTATAQLTINKRGLTIAATDETKTFGQTFTEDESTPGDFTIGSGDPATTTDKLVNGDSITSVSLDSSGYVNTAPVSGSPYTITPSSAVFATVGDAGNYNITYDTGELTVNPASLTASITVVTKQYDGNTDAVVNSCTLNGVLTLATAVSCDFSGVSDATFNNPNVGTGKPVTGNLTGEMGGLTLSGADSDNYNLTYAGGLGEITIRLLTVTGLTAQNKTYDGNATATVTGTPVLSTVVGTETVTLSGSPTWAFSDPDGAGTLGAEDAFATARPVIATGSYSIGGPDAGNYGLTQPALTAKINKKSVTVNPDNWPSAPTSYVRYYDNTTHPDPSTDYSVSYEGFITGEDETNAQGISGAPPSCDDDWDPASEQAGTYQITCPVTGLSATNYTFTAGNPGKLYVSGYDYNVVTEQPIPPFAPLGGSTYQVSYGDPRVETVTRITYSGADPGETLAKLVTPSDPGYVDPPVGLSTGTRLNYVDIVTTVLYSSAQVCMTYLENDFGSVISPTLYNYYGGEWNPLAGVAGSSSREICGTTTHFSPFVLAAPLSPTAARAEIGGRVLDVTGKAVSGAKISVLDTTTGEIKLATADRAGRFNVGGLETGRSFIVTASSRFGTLKVSRQVDLYESLTDFDLTLNK